MSDADHRKHDPDLTRMFQSQSQSTKENTGAADTAAPAAGGLLAGYPRSQSAFDELLGDDGAVRPHFGKLIGDLEEFGATELQRRSDTCQRLVHEQGITYNVYGDPRGMERPWQLDPMPFIIAPDEWRTLE